MKSRRERAVPLREVFVHITDNYLDALILQQMLYWCARRKDFIKYMEEFKHNSPGFNSDPIHGWIYKTSRELQKELFNIVGHKTVSRHLIDLVESGIIDRRKNPEYNWDHTYQYRINLEVLIQEIDKADLPEDLDKTDIMILKYGETELKYKNLTS
jgi:hypothetical protein